MAESYPRIEAGDTYQFTKNFITAPFGILRLIARGCLLLSGLVIEHLGMMLSKIILK